MLARPWEPDEVAHAARRGVRLVDPAADGGESNCAGYEFAPWGWSASAVATGERLGARVDAPPLDAVARVNSKLFSHALEREWKVTVPGADVASDMGALDRIVHAACPGAEDKWVVKSPFGVAARERVLGRGPRLDDASRAWARRRFAEGQTPLFEPWLDVVREYGVLMRIERKGEVRLEGVSDQQTNGAGTTTHYVLGRRASDARRVELEATALRVGERLAREGYWGPAGLDALETKGADGAPALRPILEINARYTLGFVAVAVERARRPSEPVLWEPRFAPEPE